MSLCNVNRESVTRENKESSGLNGNGHFAHSANGINEKDLQLPFDDLSRMQRWQLLIVNGIDQSSD